MTKEVQVLRAAQMFTKTGQASKVSVVKEILIGTTLGISLGLMWQRWHWSESLKWENYYKALAQK